MLLASHIHLSEALKGTGWFFSLLATNHHDKRQLKQLCHHHIASTVVVPSEVCLKAVAYLEAEKCCLSLVAVHLQLHDCATTSSSSLLLLLYDW